VWARPNAERRNRAGEPCRHCHGLLVVEANPPPLPDLDSRTSTANFKVIVQRLTAEEQRLRDEQLKNNKKREQEKQQEKQQAKQHGAPPSTTLDDSAGIVADLRTRMAGALGALRSPEQRESSSSMKKKKKKERKIERKEKEAKKKKKPRRWRTHAFNFIHSVRNCPPCFLKLP
jgi:hypothetical protein